MTRPFGQRDLPPEPTAILDELIDVARHYGEDVSFSRAGGGNASAKAGGVLYIKPSGIPLAELTRDALVPLDMTALLTLLGAGDGVDEPGTDPVMRAAREARLGTAGGRRPSVEFLFHALMPERFVLHTHPIVLNAVTCNRDGAALAARLFGDRTLWIPYTTPGLPLARAIGGARAANESETGRAAPPVTLIQNHGIIVAGDTAKDIRERTSWVTDLVQTAFSRGPAPAAASYGVGPDRARSLVDAIAPALRVLLAAGEGPRIVTFDDTPLAVGYPATPTGRAFVLGGPLTPDQIVYAGSWPMLLDLPPHAERDAILATVGKRLDEHVAATGQRPVIVVVPGLGLFAAGETWAQADTARHIYLDALRVGQGATRLGDVRPLPRVDRLFIETWEAEAYRRGVAAGDRRPGPAAGKVAIVTGAARGPGLAIAADLAAGGAHVVLADLDVDLARVEAAALESRFGPGRAMAIAMNVTVGASVADAIHATVRRYGGFDLLVSNVGEPSADGMTFQALEVDLVGAADYRGYSRRP